MPYCWIVARKRSDVIRDGPQGRVVIPAPVRRRLGIATGDELTLVVEDERMLIERRATAAARAHGMFQHLDTGASVVDELIAERREEARREEAS